MPIKHLPEFVKLLEKSGELIRISHFVDPVLEITEITDRISKSPNGGKALLFENTGTNFPLLINGLGSNKRMCLAFGVDNLDIPGNELESLFKKITSPKNSFLDKLYLLPSLQQISAWMPRVIKGKVICQEVIHKNPDLNILPILKCWPHDGGRFITLPIVNTKDPITGIRNAGMYRLQVFGKDLTGMHWHKHKVGARHYMEYKSLGKKMPVAVALGGDPILTYSATAPLPDNMDEYMLAGYLRKQKVDLVKCITQDIEVPAEADIIIEGYVDPCEELIWEGPFGDHTGYYSLPDWYPKFHVTCITHRKNAIYPATIVGIPPQEDAYIAKATERLFLAPIRLTLLPELVDMDIPVEGVAHNLTIVKIKKTFPGQALKVMNALWGAGQMMFNKNLVVVNEEVDIHNYPELCKVISINVDPETDIHFSMGPMDVLDHSSSSFAYGGKMCIDATVKLPEERSISLIGNILQIKNLIDISNIQKVIPEIKDINGTLLNNDISLVILSVNKNKELIKNLKEKLFEIDVFKNIKFVCLVDEKVDINDIATSVWLISNNIDPKRDCIIIPTKGNDETSHIIINGTRKDFEFDDFKRDWPNIIVMDDNIIQKIDSTWASLGLGNFIKSPSLKYQKLVINNDAVVKKNN
jgi:4-hydroxy-3-polyprenylbenzoate decarboxylase